MQVRKNKQESWDLCPAYPIAVQASGGLAAMGAAGHEEPNMDSDQLMMLSVVEKEIRPTFDDELRPKLEALFQSEAPSDAAAKLREALDLVDAFVVRLSRTARQAPACAAGCDFCCHTHQVIVSELEAIALVRAVLAHPARHRIMPRLIGATPATDGPGGKPCPMLGDDGLCSVHPSRPATCRTYLSVSRKACKRFAQKRGPRPATVPAYPYAAYRLLQQV